MHFGARAPLGGGASAQLLNSLSSKGMIPTEGLPGAPTFATVKVSTAGFAARADGAIASIAASIVPASTSALPLLRYPLPTKCISPLKPILHFGSETLVNRYDVSKWLRFSAIWPGTPRRRLVPPQSARSEEHTSE